MKNNHLIFKIRLILIIIFLLIILNLNLVTAIGIRPAKTNIDFSPSLITSGEFWVVNNDLVEFKAKVYVEGELGKYVNLETTDLNFRSDTDALPVSFKLVLPVQVPPGESTASIVVEQATVEAKSDTISSRIIIKHKIIILGPYPEKYITAKLNFQEQDNVVEFVSEVNNLGQKDINDLQTTFYVNDQKQQEHILETEKIGLAQNENKLLKRTLDKNLFEQGEFEVSAVTKYDDQQVEVVKSLVLGQPRVEVTYFDRFFTANKINQYTLDLLNRWNREIKNVFVDVEVQKDDKKIDGFRTKSIDLGAELSKRINDYYDARGKDPGTYTFNMVVNFWNLVRMEQNEFKFQTEFLEDGEALPSKIPELAEPKINESNLGLWLVSLFGLLLLVCGSYVAWRYIHRDEYENEINDESGKM
ncbi:hypothetical protein J4437_03720 [Candidatus Woesearchaeota archaeon]|nr:hypothetical protein [Candidatus Woesearchaeota archaeon]